MKLLRLELDHSKGTLTIDLTDTEAPQVEGLHFVLRWMLFQTPTYTGYASTWKALSIEPPERVRLILQLGSDSGVRTICRTLSGEDKETKDKSLTPLEITPDKWDQALQEAGISKELLQWACRGVCDFDGTYNLFKSWDVPLGKFGVAEALVGMDRNFFEKGKKIEKECREKAEEGRVILRKKEKIGFEVSRASITAMMLSYELRRGSPKEEESVEDFSYNKYLTVWNNRLRSSKRVGEEKRLHLLEMVVGSERCFPEIPDYIYEKYVYEELVERYKIFGEIDRINKELDRAREAMNNWRAEYHELTKAKKLQGLYGRWSQSAGEHVREIMETDVCVFADSENGIGVRIVEAPLAKGGGFVITPYRDMHPRTEDIVRRQFFLSGVARKLGAPDFVISAGWDEPCFIQRDMSIEETKRLTEQACRARGERMKNEEMKKKLGLGELLQSTDLRRMDLSKMNFREIDPRDANLEEADLRDANLEGGDLRGANLKVTKVEKNED